MPDYTAIQAIRNFKGLIRYLRTELEWPVDEDQADDLTFDYEPEELGLDEKHKVKIREIKQIRPLADGQPWGIFWIDFEPKRLPVVVLRRILGALAASQRRARRNVKQARWDIRDLMFISATGQGSERGVSFAHFRETDDGQPQLRTFSWDVRETHLYYIKNLNLAALRWPVDSANAEAWRERWAAAFTAGHRETIRTSEALAVRMAQLADATRHAVNEAFVYEKPTGPLHKLYESFKKVLIHDLSVDDFADMYAQTVTYGLFSARATRSGTFALDAERVVGLIPNTNPFLRDLLAECLKVSQGTRRAQIDLDELGVGELVETLQNTDIESVLRDWGRQRRGEDPVIHFYETFLRQYDAQKKTQRGVFYTPDPVVSFIVRSVDYLLRTEFGCKDGLATTLPSPSGTIAPEAKRSGGGARGKGEFSVQVLDPATGTGTFLKYVIEQIHDTFQKKHSRISHAEMVKKWNEYVPAHLLPRLYGFELMMAPYAVAHMKLGLALKQTEYDFASAERLRVYLTNALQSVDEIPRVDTAFLAHEAEEANTVKTETPITVIIGNPPYSNFGMMNKGEWVLGLVDEYKKGLNEKKVNLGEDSIKFIRFAQWRLERTGQGILAFITNNTYLDGITHRRMRQSLLESFDSVYILNLHGSGGTRKQETTPDGSVDENVFDIQQGVSIGLFVRKSAKKKTAQGYLYYADLWGVRKDKYSRLVLADVATTEWIELRPESPQFFFVPKNFSLQDEYSAYVSVNEEMFGESNAGIQTKNDGFVYQHSKEDIERTVGDLRKLDVNALVKKYELSTEGHWSAEAARTDIRQNKGQFAQVHYHPFDKRWTYYTAKTSGFMARPRAPLMKNGLLPNLLFLTVRNPRRGNIDCFLVSDTIVDKDAVSPFDNVTFFPLYVYPEQSRQEMKQGALFNNDATSGGRKPNLSPKFIADAEAWLGLTFIPDGMGTLTPGPSPARRGGTVGPEDLFHYMYAVFHSPTYRARYAEFLKIDFPRLPLTRNLELFRTLAAKGKELVSLHLLEAKALNHPITKLTGKGNNIVASGYPYYEDGTVWINDEQGFAGVPEAVWGFQIGGYQVCHKWLKDRRGRELSAEDKAHYAKIVVALKETIRLMTEIDAAIPGWPLE